MPTLSIRGLWRSGSDPSLQYNSAAAVAMNDTVLFEIKHEPFKQMLADYPLIKEQLMLLQMDRLFLLNRLLHEMKFHDARARDMIGTLRETATLVLKDLQEQKIIEIQHQQITVLDPKYLLEYTNFD
ncbi:Crp/Fnr family transcriptional regulator [Paenibacillus sp. FSL H8-0260]|uniref:Crp/Fnr family transcriptional regulator n=1 Tax=Paenibacillus sp. FSL H8-0260 TaxID=2921380 RepID=UPI0032444260